MVLTTAASVSLLTASGPAPDLAESAVAPAPVNAAQVNTAPGSPGPEDISRTAPGPASAAPGQAATVGTRSAALRPATPRSAPARLQIDSAGIDVPVEPVGVSQDGQMALPESVGTAGWYRFGPGMGDPRGTVVIAGHVDSRQAGLGPLAALAGSAPGAAVHLADARGGEKVYRIERVTRTPRREIDLAALFSRTGAPRLVLITCGGPYDRAHGYRDLVVVSATPR